jgi:hypothetical protein
VCWPPSAFECAILDQDPQHNALIHICFLDCLAKFRKLRKKFLSDSQDSDHSNAHAKFGRRHPRGCHYRNSSVASIVQRDRIEYAVSHYFAPNSDFRDRISIRFASAVAA